MTKRGKLPHEKVLAALRYFGGEALLVQVSTYTKYSADKAWRVLKQLELDGKVHRRNPDTKQETWYL
jgi:hypothetical protein